MAAFLSVPDAAAHLGVHPALIYKEIRAGRLLAVKIGAKVIRIPMTSLESYIQTQLSSGGN